jgi:hypothetical protein
MSGRAILSTVKPSLLAAAILLAILIAIYGPGIGKGFVKDDVVWVGNNQVTSWADLRALLVRTDGFYRPLVAATFAIDRAIYGVEPFGFGVTNLILLLLGAAALAYLGTTLGLPATTAVIGAGVWALNFHAVNMAVLWLSGRTALCVVIAALLAAALVVKRQPIAAGIAALLAMLAKEEAVTLPVILSGWAWILWRENEEGRYVRLGNVVRLTWPMWVALAIYLALRAQTTAMTPMTATASYRFVLAPGALVANALEYLDRACTFSVIVVIVAHLIAWRRPAMTAGVRRMLILGAIWFVGTFALTIFVPNRSSLYALLPSIAPALVAGFLLQQLWDVSSQQTGTSGRTRPTQRLMVAAVALPLLLLPVYWLRNVRWTEIAELSTDTFAVIRRVARERPDVGLLVFRDDPSTRRSFANTYDELLPVAVRLAAGRDIQGRLETTDTTTPGAVRIVLKDRTVLVE